MFWKDWKLNFCSRNKRTVGMKAVDKKSTKRTRKNKKYVLGQKAVGQLSYTHCRILLISEHFFMRMVDVANSPEN